MEDSLLRLARRERQLRLPFQWTVMQDGKKFATVTVQDYKINSGLTEEVLGKKP